MITIREAVIEDLPAMLNIYNYAIRCLNATFDLAEQTIEERKLWFKKYGGKYPLIVAEENGVVVGYSSLSPFRDKEAYAKTTELSIYIAEDSQGKGIGKKLMEEILNRAKTKRFHTVIGGITGGNEASVKLHLKFGFEYVGTFKEVGYKFDQWQDVEFYQLIIK